MVLTCAIEVSFVSNVNQKVLPSPRADSTPISPFIKAQSCLEIARPRPVPPKDFRDELSSWVNDVNKICLSVALIPIPESCTSTLILWNNPSFFTNVRMSSTEPFSVNFKALDVRLDIICKSLVWSAMMNLGISGPIR
ncbi:hypothetical protein D3C87_1726690 [compost metagenome]